MSLLVPELDSTLFAASDDGHSLHGDAAIDLASTLVVAGPPSSPQKSPSRRLSAQAMFSSLSLRSLPSSPTRPSFASLFKRAPSPSPAPLGHALPPLPDFGSFVVDVPVAVPDNAFATEPNRPASPANITNPIAIPPRSPSVASVSSASISIYSEDDPSDRSLETPNTSFSHLPSGASSPKRAHPVFLLHRPIAEHPSEPSSDDENERGRKRSDVSTLRHVASQAFTRRPPTDLKLPARSRSAAPRPTHCLLRVPSSPARSPRFRRRATSPTPSTPSRFTSRPSSPVAPRSPTRAASPLPSARQSLLNVGFLSSARSSQASLGTNAGVPPARSPIRRMFSRSHMTLDGSRFSDDEDDFEILSPPRDAGWRGMLLYGGTAGQGQLAPDPKAHAPRLALVVRLDSGNNFDLGLGAFESVRKWCATYGPVSSIQVDNRRSLPTVSLSSLNLKRRTDSALRVEFRDKTSYDAVCPGGVGSIRTVDMRGVGRVALELSELK